MESVNSTTVQQSPAEAMIQLGNCMKILVATLTDNQDPNYPFWFAKLDIKEGFRQMAVNNVDAWNICYVSPQAEQSTDINDALLVVPNYLQMGWCKSPLFFCTASETAQDIIAALLQEAALPHHPLEHQMMKDVDLVLNFLLQAAYHTSTLWRSL